MKKTLNSLICALLAVAVLASFSAPAQCQEEKKDPNAFKVSWKDGLTFESDNVQFKIGGYWQFDNVWGSYDDGAEAKFGAFKSINGTRRARIGFEGTLYGNIEIKTEYDFNSGTASFQDFYVGFKGLPFGTLRVGKTKEPFSLEELTSDKNSTFIERSLPNMFSPSRNIGIAIAGNDSSETFTWNFGVYTVDETGRVGGTYDDTYDFAGRLTFLPWKSGKSDLIHLGIAYRYHGVKDGGTVSYSSRPEVSLISKFIDTKSFAADSSNSIGAELGFVAGAFHGAAEYMQVSNDSPDFGDPEFNSWYAYVGYFLTGESRQYKKSQGLFDKTKPNESFTKSGGIGAWEIALRYSQADLTDAKIVGGELKDFSVALNWYINNLVCYKFNYVLADRDDITKGKANMFFMRMQLVF